MKKMLFFTFVTLFLSYQSFCQNIFPSNGNVGIGTASPFSLLTLNDPTRAEILLQTNGSNIAAFSVNSNSSTWNGAYAIGLNLIATSADINLLTGIPAVPAFIVKNSGNVGVGTINPDAKLAVNGTIHTKEVKVDLSIPVPDYVFKPTYQLSSLKKVKAYIDKNHHLPEIPSAAQIEKEGLDLGEASARQLKKIEELTLYLIEKDKQLNQQNQRIRAQALRLKNLETTVKRLAENLQ